MSAFGTNRTNRVSLMMSVVRGRPEVAGRGQDDAIDPEATLADTIPARVGAKTVISLRLRPDTLKLGKKG
jgi:hypothetical protein